VRIARAEADAFYVVAAFPIEVDRISGNLRTPSVCLVIGSSERRRRVTGEALVDVLELTPGEARVAAALANGENLISISQQLGIAHNTARALLARVFRKTNTSSQTGLLALILNCIPTL
jgi:DNA-binding CsgD family transcriptional regulator